MRFFRFSNWTKFLVSLVMTMDLSFAEENATGRYEALETLARAMYHLETMYVEPEKTEISKMVDDALEGIISKLDPHTVRMPKRAYKQLTIDTKGKFGGIGIVVSSEDKKLMIVSPIEDSPASRAGIRAGDEIIAIDDTPLSEIDQQQAVEMMLGAPGSIIKLQIKRKESPEPINYSLKREIIKIKSIKSISLGDSILYVRIANFQENTAQEMEKILSENPSLQGMILDLRDNPGGLLDQSVKIVDLFVDSGLIVSTVGRNKKHIDREFAKMKKTYNNFPMVVLVNGGTASASEIVAGALQDHERALIMGTSTFGKGSVQTLVTLPDGSGLKLTVARYYTPKDRSIQAKGIEPDIYVPSKLAPQGHDRTKEADLEGHIVGGDLSDLSQKSNMLSAVKQWPNTFQGDHQLITGFTYIKSWAAFNKSKFNTETARLSK